MNVWGLHKMKNSLEKKSSNTAIRPRNITEAIFDLTSNENDIIDIVLANVGAEPESQNDNLFYSVKVSDYIKYFDGKSVSNNIYNQLEKASKSLQKKTFTLWDDKDTEHVYSWVQETHYRKKMGQIDIVLGQSFKKMLVSLKKNRKQSKIFYSLQYSLPMQSQYSKRIYYLCKQWIGKELYCNIDDLKQKLCIPKSYNTNNIKKFILEKAKDEVNRYTDIRINYNEVYDEKSNRKGRRQVIGITFVVKQAKIKNQAIESFKNTKKQENKKNRFNDFQNQSAGGTYNGMKFEDFEQQILSNC